MEEVLKKNKFDDLRAHFKPSQLPFSDSSVEQAERILKETDFPTRKNEHWKYTSLNGLLKLPFDGEVNGASSAPQISSNAKRIIIKNGQIPADVSINGVKTNWKSMPKISEEDPFDALNLLHCTSAVEIVFDQENTSDIELVFENTENNFVFPRTYIKCCKQSKGNVIINFQGSGANASFINASTFIEVEENAHLVVHKIQKNGLNTFDLQREYVNQAANSSFTMNTFCLSGRLTRNDLNIKVNGNNCETFMNGSYTLKGKSHCDNHTTVDHKVAHCYSKELYKGVVDDRATNVFNGKVFVRKDAQKINAFQSNANILLSETGTINSKPELEIYADDVKCSHGSTTGQLDEEAVFYLRSRGLSEKSAKELLVKAFLGEVLEEIDHEDVRTYLEEQIELHFEA
jgi:Fe-S cluster assembly protein SufD